MLDISLDDPKYYKEVGKLMAKDLPIEIRRQLAIKLGGGAKSEVQPMKTEVLDQMLDHAEKLTTERNRYTHGNWVIRDETGPIIRDRNFETKQLEAYMVPSTEELTKLASECEAMATMFDGLTSVSLKR